MDGGPFIAQAGRCGIDDKVKRLLRGSPGVGYRSGQMLAQVLQQGFSTSTRTVFNGHGRATGFGQSCQHTTGCASCAEKKDAARGHIDSVIGHQIAHKASAIGVVALDAFIIVTAHRVDGAGQLGAGCKNV